MAGLKVAETAARRGHRVTVIERERALGGLLLLASKQPEHANIAEVVSYLEIVASEMGVTILRGQTATPDMIHGLAPDVVVVATGSQPNIPRALDSDTSLSQSLGQDDSNSCPANEREFH